MNPLALTGIVTGVGKVLDKLFTSDDERNKAKLAFYEMQQRGELQEIEQAAKIIVAEATGDSWLQRNWRPLTMITFTSLIVSRWLGFSAPNMPPELEMQLFDIIKIGLGGYVVGRSVEKGIDKWNKN